MTIMNGNKPVAVVVMQGRFPIKIRALDGVKRLELPLPLFGLKATEVSYEKFLEWIKTRCFPKERMDCKECLETLGLKEYNPLQIVMKTQGRLTCHDDFWIDFNN